jgi:catechol 2,3-dioxygenase-like lactoylglutathione lyase family enzyme
VADDTTRLDASAPLWNASNGFEIRQPSVDRGEAMEIRQFRVVLRAHDFDRTCAFYGETLALPRLQSWDRENGRGALYQAGTGVIEVLGRPHGDDRGRDERYDYAGPDQKLEILLQVPSAERAYEEILFRYRNIPGGLRTEADGSTVFATSDPDGVHILFRG